jgi:hypothetical protein
VISSLAIGFVVLLLTYVAPKLLASVVPLVLALHRVGRFRIMGMLGQIGGFLGVVVIIVPSTTQGQLGLEIVITRFECAVDVRFGKRKRSLALVAD